MTEPLAQPAESRDMRSAAYGAQIGSTSWRGRVSIGRMSWDEAFANRYAEWSAHMTAAVAF